MDKKIFELISLGAFPLLPLVLEYLVKEAVEFKSLSITAAVYAAAVAATVRLKTFNGICICVAVVSAGIHGGSMNGGGVQNGALPGLMWFLIIGLSLLLVADRLWLSTQAEAGK